MSANVLALHSFQHLDFVPAQDMAIPSAGLLEAEIQSRRCWNSWWQRWEAVSGTIYTSAPADPSMKQRFRRKITSYDIDLETNLRLAKLHESNLTRRTS